jgi:hypothetical protein
VRVQIIEMGKHLTKREIKANEKKAKKSKLRADTKGLQHDTAAGARPPLLPPPLLHLTVYRVQPRRQRGCDKPQLLAVCCAVSFCVVS